MDAKDNKIILGLSDLSLKELDLTKGSITALAFPNKNLQSLASLALYNNNLYVLDSKAGQIWKYPPGEKGFNEPKAWLKTTNPSLLATTILGIDGSIYAISPQGIVQKFDQGRPSAFTAFHSPAPVNVSKFWTKTASKFMYFLDAPSGRLIVLSKETGKPLIQYTAPQVVNALDFVVEENAKKIYLLLPEGVFSFEATHLAKSQ